MEGKEATVTGINSKWLKANLLEQICTKELLEFALNGKNQVALGTLNFRYSILDTID